MSSISQGMRAIANEPANRPVLNRFFQAATATAVVPVLVYFLTAFLARRMTSVSPPIAGGIAAVLALNTITASFALYAVHEKLDIPPRPVEQEQQMEGEDDGEMKEESVAPSSSEAKKDK